MKVLLSKITYRINARTRKAANSCWVQGMTRRYYLCIRVSRNFSTWVRNPRKSIAKANRRWVLAEIPVTLLRIRTNSVAVCGPPELYDFMLVMLLNRNRTCKDLETSERSHRSTLFWKYVSVTFLRSWSFIEESKQWEEWSANALAWQNEKWYRVLLS